RRRHYRGGDMVRFSRNHRWRMSAMATALLAVAATATVRANTGDPFGAVPIPADNPLTAAKVALGKELFWDLQLSSNNTVACGSCHLPEFGGSVSPALNPGPDGKFGTSDDVFGAAGIHGQPTGRQAPSAIAAFAFTTEFWDGRAGPNFFNPTNPSELVVRGGALE